MSSAAFTLSFSAWAAVLMNSMRGVPVTVSIPVRRCRLQAVRGAVGFTGGREAGSREAVGARVTAGC
ncbi:hypothetical protein Q5W_12320 [Hydrogenophaga sp. PBC]|nr:hypothetical protein Q5W_12320 [Hydrogenophaga sp. PBC]